MVLIIKKKNAKKEIESFLEKKGYGLINIW